jgi:hypothetical protein
MTARVRWLEAFAVSGFVIALGSASAVAQKKYDVGVTDSEIKIGNVMPYSGPGSAYAAIGKTEAAYFKMINDQGGINGGKSISFPTTIATMRRRRRADAQAGGIRRGVPAVQHRRDSGLPFPSLPQLTR